MDQIKAYIVEDNFYAAEALSMYCLKSHVVTVLDTLTLSQMEQMCKEDKVKALKDDVLFLVSTLSNKTPQDVLSVLDGLSDKPNVVILGDKLPEEIFPELLSVPVLGIFDYRDIGFSIGNAINVCKKDQIVVSTKYINAVLKSISQTNPAEIRVVSANQDIRWISPRTEKTIHMFCLWGMAKGEIAELQQVSSSTVGSRLKSGYALLGVTSRLQVQEKILSIDM